mgnify:FL=1
MWWRRQEATYDEQYYFWDRYVHHGGNLAVAPWAIGPITPFGWRQIGSNHQVQADGWSHTADYGIAGCEWEEFHDVAWGYGIGFIVRGEPWHGGWWDSSGVYTVTTALPPPPPPISISKDLDMAKLVRCDDGDIAVFVTDGVKKSWVRDPNAYVSLRDVGIAEAAPDGSPYLISRTAVDSLALVGMAPQYRPDYDGPRTA